MICTIQDLEIYYEVYGEGKPIIMLNGNNVDMRSMIYCMEPIFEGNKQWKRIYIDQPGTGKTKAKDWIQSSDNLLYILLEFVDKILPNEKFSIAGRSLGGYLALGMLKKRFDKINGLLLICPGILSENEKRDIDEGLEDIINLDPQIEKRIEERVKKELAVPSEATDKEYIKRIVNKLSLSFRVDALDKEFEKPVLIITGRQDTVTGFRDAFKLLHYFKRATFCVLDKAGHIPQIEQEQLFNELVKEWLYRVEEEELREIYNNK